MTNKEVRDCLEYMASTVPQQLQSSVQSLQVYFQQPNLMEPEEYDETKVDQSLLQLLVSDEWPEAIYSKAITDMTSEESKEDRADGILSFVLNSNLEGKRFLDFGCGEGHVATQAKFFSARHSVGYDVVKSGVQLWEKNFDNCILTTNLKTVEIHAPYDVILLYDVMDHLIEGYNPVEVLSQVKDLLSDNGYIQVRMHPWCSRHGGHHYNNVNKAFIHLVLNEAEIEQIGLKSCCAVGDKVIHPLATYNRWISQAGLKVKGDKPTMLRNPVEPFFKNITTIRKRIKRHWAISTDRKAKEWPEYPMSFTYLDYVLTK